MKNILLCLLFSLQLGAAVWSEPVTISSQGGFQPIVKFDDQGNAVAIWGINNGTFDLQAASLPFQGSWTAPVTIASTGLPQAYALAVSPEGNAVALWQQAVAGPTFSIHSASYISGVWEPSITVKSPSGFLSQFLSVAVDTQGNAVAVWLDSIGMIFWAALPEGGAWTMPALLSAGNTPQVAIAPNGTAIAVWSNAMDQIESATLAPGAGSWSATTIISPPAVTATFPLIEIDPLGNAIAVWRTSVNLIQSSVLLSGASSWINLQSVPTQAPPLNTSLAIDSHGNAMIVWRDTSNLIQSSTIPFGGVWTSPEVIAIMGFVPSVALDHHGNASMIYSFGGILYASTRIVGGTWTEPVIISNPSTPTTNGSVAADLYGNALILFSPTLSGPTQSRSLLHPSVHIRSDRAFLRPSNRR
jgi:hypothetical protein